MPTIRLPNPDGGFFDLDTDDLTPEELEEVQGQLVAVDQLVEKNPLWGFRPFGSRGTQEGAQVAFLGHRPTPTDVDIKMGIAGNQSGKTTIGIVDDLIQLCDRSALPPWLQQYKFWDPPFKLRVVTMDLNTHLHGVFIPKFQELCPKDQLKGGSWDDAYNKTRRVLEFKNGSSVQFLSAEQSREVHQGWTGDRIHFDEEPPPPHGYDIYRESRFRVMARQGQLMFTMTPLLGLSWTYDELWTRRNDPAEQVFGVQWSLIDNVEIPNSAIKREIAACRSEREYRARILGDFTSFRGRVFEQFDESKHLIERPDRKIIQDLDVIVGLDPGLSKGGVVWCGFDKENRMVVFDEFYFSNVPMVSPDKQVHTVVQQIRMVNAKWGIKPLFYVVDPASRIRDMVTGTESVMTTMIREGFVTVPGENDRMQGILELWGRLEANPPALVVSKTCTNWLHERDRYLVHQDEEGGESRPKTGKGATFSTLGPDHLMDPTRYVAMARAWGVAPSRSSTARPSLTDQLVGGQAPDMRTFRRYQPEQY
jgi:phage terminase large subunit-like protein